MTTPPLDIPPRVSNGPIHKPLSPAENEEFVRKQAEFEAAYRCTGEPLALLDALRDLRGRESEFFYFVALVDELGHSGSTVVSDGTSTYCSSDYVGSDYQQFNGHTVAPNPFADRGN